MTPWDRGNIAFDDNKGIDSNPYSANTKEWREWRSGWRDAQAIDDFLSGSDSL